MGVAAGQTRQGQTPISYAATGKHVAVRYIYGLKGVSTQQLTQHLQTARELSRRGRSDAELQVRWFDHTAYATLSPRSPHDDEWQSTQKLAERLEYIFVTALAKVQSENGGGFFRWCVDRSSC